MSHFFTEAHPYWRQRVIVVGGGNSAVEAALELYRVGAHVTIVHFLDQLDRGVKPWVLPDITNRLKDGSVAAHWRSRVLRIEPASVVITSEITGATETLPADFVLALTGYRADQRLLRMLGVNIDGKTGVPQHDPQTMETNIPGVYIAGVVSCGFDREQGLHRERPRARGADLRPYKSTTPQSCPRGVIACHTPCALDPDVSETTLVLMWGLDTTKPQALVSVHGAAADDSGSRAVSTVCETPMLCAPPSPAVCPVQSAFALS